MKLKLAQYNLETGKFERFLELSMNRDGFGYYGDRIVIRRFTKTNNHPIHEYLDIEDVYDLDEKDPLNRFDGLFDGITYGQGRFVLVIDTTILDKNNTSIESFSIIKDYEDAPELVKFREGYVNVWEPFAYWDDGCHFEIVGNLFENPELYEKIK